VSKEIVLIVNVSSVTQISCTS